MKANKVLVSSLSSLASILFKSRLILCGFLLWVIFLQMEIVPLMVCLKTLISAELSITANVV